MLIRWLLSLVLNAVVLIIVSMLFDSFYLAGFKAALLASVILAILNMVVKPILILFTLPITILTLGLFLFVINAVTLLLAQALMGSSFVIDGFGTAFLAAIVITVLNTILNRVVKDTIN